MSENKYRSQYVEDKGWFVTFGPRRPTAQRKWLAGPMTQQEAEKKVKELINETRTIRNISERD
jgi:hypothetical protein